MKTFNKRGDEGETSLLYGGRIAKSDPRPEAYGTIDEAVAALGLARSLSPKEKVAQIAFRLQKELFTVAAELAITPENRPQFVEKYGGVTSEMVDALEALIDWLESAMILPQAFVIPGANASAAALDLARATIRRAERRAVTLKEEGLLENPAVLSYLNRLADLLFLLARYQEAD